MINLDRVQECRPLHLTHPTPRHGRFNRRRWQTVRSFPAARKVARVTSKSRYGSHEYRYVKLQVWTRLFVVGAVLGGLSALDPQWISLVARMTGECGGRVTALRPVRRPTARSRSEG